MTDTADIGDVHGPATSAALTTVWNTWGRLDDHVIAHLVNPSFMGGPRWPGLRQAHVISRRPDALLVASDGLADPIEWPDDPPGNGFELEVYAIAGADEIPADADTTAVSTSWLGRMVMSMSQTVAGNGLRVRTMLDRYGTITVSMPGLELPESASAFMPDDGAPIVLLGLEGDEVPSSIDGPLSNIRLVNVKLLTVAEADFCVSGGTGDHESRAEIARRITDGAHPLWSSLTRESTA